MTHNEATTDEQSTNTSPLRRRRFIEATGAAVATSALAGCDEGTDGTDGSGGTGGTATEGPDGNDSDGGDGEPSGPEGPMRIGHLAPTSGSVDFIGRGSRRSAQIAVDQINENGGLLGAQVELIHEDTESSPSTAQAAVQRLMDQNVDLIVGTYVTEVTQAILAYIAQFDVPFIVTGSAAPSTVTDFIGQNYDQYKNFFRTGPINSFFQAQGLAGYAEFLNEQHGWTDFGLAPEDATWTRTFSEVLPDMLGARDFDISYNERLSLSISNWGPIRDDLSSSGIDAVFRFFAHLTGGQFLGEWTTFEGDYGVEGTHVAGMLPSFNELAEGNAIYSTTSQSGAGGVAAITEHTQPFVEEYASRHEGEEPPGPQPMYMGFNTYDGINFWRDVVEETGSWDASENLDDLVANALEVQHRGAVGDISLYGPDSQYPHDVYVPGADSEERVNFPVTQWSTSGEVECVYPEEYATSSHLAPSWM